ncbi:hypothetical protein [Acidimicrobium ferrooxidans]|uniref:hypothetical protein n=1 Tax=Acidimicrobium ferrooxidans TaxID=53635 RepID=UPI001494A36B|nr:hypothetical protein [Acidimicrobium ferrooxidans]
MTTSHHWMWRIIAASVAGTSGVGATSLALHALTGSTTSSRAAAIVRHDARVGRAPEPMPTPQRPRSSSPSHPAPPTPAPQAPSTPSPTSATSPPASAAPPATPPANPPVVASSTPPPASALADPPANIAPTPNFASICASSISAGPDGPTCESAAVEAIDAARAQEGLGPLTLPPNFTDLSPTTQLLWLINEERTARGLAPAAGVVDTLSALAEDGAASNSDPPLGSLTTGGPWAVSAEANWAADYSTAASMYDWMYDDGWGGSSAATTNETCTSPTAAGCWEHRANILATAPAGYVPVLGLASQPEPSGTSLSGLESDAMVLTFVPTSALSSLSFVTTWP